MLKPIIIVVLLFLSVLLVVLTVLNRYTKIRNRHWVVITIVIIAWTFPFSAFFLLPIDLSSTSYDNCSAIQSLKGENCEKPLIYLEKSVLAILWRVVYWTAFFLTWLIIPIAERYIDQGGRNKFRKLRWAIVRELIYFAVVGTLGGIFVLYTVIKTEFTSFDALKGYLVAIANCWGLILIITFMGYGLIDIPRKLYKQSDPMSQLLNLEREAPLAKDRLIDSEHELSDCVSTFLYILDTLSPDDPLRLEAEYSLQRLDVELLTQPRPRRPDGNIDLKLLEKIDLKLKRAIHHHRALLANWNQLLVDAFHVQDVINCAGSSDRKLTSELRLLSGSKWDDFKISIQWYYFEWVSPVIFKVLSLLTALISIMVIWSELTFNIQQPTLSIMAIIFQYIPANSTPLQLVSGVIVIYMSYCAYATLFQVKLFNYYVLVPNQHTDDISLLFSGAYLCRLAMPLYYNFLLLSHQAGQTNTQFSSIMGTMNLVPFLGSTFNYLFPILIFVPISCAITGWHVKALRYLSVESILFDGDNEDRSQARGRELFKTERSRAQRAILFSSPTPDNFNRTGQSSRSIAIEPIVINEPQDDVLEHHLSTSQKIKKFFGNWRYATTSNSRPSTPEVYRSIPQLGSDFDDDEGLDDLA